MPFLKYRKSYRNFKMTIAKNKVVSIDYTLKDETGAVIDSSKDSSPLEYVHGTGKIISGLEALLEGKSEGDSFSAVIEPKDGYGEYDKSLLIEVPRKNFDEGTEIKEGMKFQASSPGGPSVVTVKKVTDDVITIDANHELAGKQLHFDVKVVSVRDATNEDMEPLSGCGGGCSGCSGSCGGCGGSCDE